MNTPPYLTPSEQVYLNGEKFASKGGVFNKTRLMHIDLQVDTKQLAQAVIAAAFAALEQQGTLRLEFHQKKRILGLGTSNVFCADVVGPMAAWPAGTLEAALPGLAQRMAATEASQNEVHAIIYALLGEDSAAPFEIVFLLIKRGLAGRGLLDSRVETHLKIFKNTVYTMPENTRLLALSQPLQPVQQLMGWYAQNRPEVWKALNDQIKRGIEARQEKSDNDDF
jgi:hypothetical protein